MVHTSTHSCVNLFLNGRRRKSPRIGPNRPHNGLCICHNRRLGPLPRTILLTIGLIGVVRVKITQRCTNRVVRRNILGLNPLIAVTTPAQRLLMVQTERQLRISLHFKLDGVKKRGALSVDIVPIGHYRKIERRLRVRVETKSFVVLLHTDKLDRIRKVRRTRVLTRRRKRLTRQESHNRNKTQQHRKDPLQIVFAKFSYDLHVNVETSLRRFLHHTRRPTCTRRLAYMSPAVHIPQHTSTPPFCNRCGRSSESRASQMPPMLLIHRKLKHRRRAAEEPAKKPTFMRLDYHTERRKTRFSRLSDAVIRRKFSI